jgi:short-subunit dehydrogenase
MNTALITGASSGIGKELARIHAKKGFDVVLVARREAQLNKLKYELELNHHIKAHVIVADLTKSDSAEYIFKQTKAKNIQIDVLINNAGFGGHGKFHERDLSVEQQMIQVNITSLVNLTHLFLKEMVQRNKGKILHVASTAGFLPGPLQAVYFATKAFVTSFSQAISQELEGSNITSTALCPGAVKTEFITVAGLEGVEGLKMAASPESVAQCGYRAMERGDLIAINELKLSFLLNWLLPFLSRKWVLKITHKLMSKSN